MFVEKILVLTAVHIDKVDDNNASHISKTGLASNLIGSVDVHIIRVVFLLLVFGSDAAVNINYMQCLGMLNDKVCTLTKGNYFAESRFDLPCNLKVVKYGL